MTTVIPINDGWYFREDYSDNDSSHLKEVRIPHTVKETPFNYFDESIYQMVSGYRKTIALKDEWKGKRIFIEFMGVAHQASVFINGNEAAVHNCGYTAFEVEVTPFIGDDGRFTVDVMVDSRESLNIPPFGYVVDYMTYGGIYREVFLKIRDGNYIKDVFVRCNGNGCLEADVVFDGEKEKIKATLCDKKTGEVVFVKDDLDASFKTEVIPGIKKWDIEDPNLYKLTIETTSDRKDITVGFRDSEFRPDGYYLNGRRVQIRGLNRHQSYPYVGYAMPRSMQILDADILKNELGLNAVRTSHYPQSQHFIDRCDEIGLLVFTEFPGWQHIGDDEWKKQAVSNLGEMILQYRNHPSIILWGVRINESLDDDAFYRVTNDRARELDPTRPTGGVRYLKKSNLLEDVYTFNDFSHIGTNRGCEKKKKVTPDTGKAYLISEYNGHMFPTKSYDPEEHMTEHAVRHANVIDCALKEGDIAGTFGWCMFDYNTHKDFGSGDRICYHGVMDMFRNPKQAAYVYSAMKDIKNDNDIVLEVGSSFDIGEHPGGNRRDIYIYTNADSVKMYKNGYFIREYTHKDSPFRHLKNGPILINDYVGDALRENEGFSERQSRIVKEALNYIGLYGMVNIPPKIVMRLGEAMAFYHMKFEDAYALYGKYLGDWGGSATEFVFEAVKDGRVVKKVTKTTDLHLTIETEVSSSVLVEKDTYDAALVRIRITDGKGNILRFWNGDLPVTVEGPVRILGPKKAKILGGMGGLYIASCGTEGKATVGISLPDEYEQNINLLSFEVKNNTSI